MRVVVFLAFLGALTIYAFHILFDAPGWGALAAFILFILGMHASEQTRIEEPPDSHLPPNGVPGAEYPLAVVRWPAALAGGLLLGIGLGWLLRDITTAGVYASVLVKVQDQRLLATTPLKTALETVASGGKPVPLSGGARAQFRAAMTFRGESHNYCRQYEFVLAAGERMGGVACRIPSGDWSVALQSVLPPPAANVTVPASADRTAALSAVVSALIQGDPIVGEAEAAIMRKGWRK